MDQIDKKIMHCDTVVIGAGTAGLEAYKAASSQGVYCILIESGPLGTSARRTGDTPINALFEAGRKSHAIKDLDRYGIRAQFPYNFDHENVLNNVRAIRAKDTAEILSFIYRIPENQRLIGQARFLDANSVQINESHIVKFKSAVIATGSTPVLPYELSSLGVDGGVYTTNDFFDIDRLPSSIAIFGSNRDGLQIGQALAYLGVKVMVFGNHKLWDLTDEAVVDSAFELFKERFDLALDCYITAIEKNENGFEIYYLDADNFENFLAVDKILSANVRFPKIAGLNLRELGINLNRKGCISVNPNTMQSSIAHIFAAGDVTSINMTSAKAQYDGHIAGMNAAKYPHIDNYQAISNLNILYTEPEIAIAGMSYDEVKQRAKEGKTFIASEIRISYGLFRTTHNDGGILRLYCDEKSHEILGAEICAHQAGSIAQLINIAIFQHQSVDQVVNWPFFTPSYQEIIHRACMEACRILERKHYGSED